MTEQNENGAPNTPESEEEQSFGELFESYMKNVKDDLRTGEQVTGEIIVIGRDTVFVNTGTKADGVVDKSELLDENGNFPYSLGDKITLYVISRDESEVRLSRAMDAQSGIHQLYEAHRSAIPVQGRVTETCKGGFRVAMAGKTAFCPVSQMDAVYVENPESYVGAEYEFLISRIEENGRNIVVSRRELLMRHMAEQKEQFLKNVSVGDIIEGKITRLMPYGAFVELIPGLEGMVHISELSWSRLEKPEDAVSAGDTVRVKILDIKEAGEEKQQTRISLSVKQAWEDPWANITEKFKTGDKVEGKVTRCADFGAFVEIAPGVEGLVHISEMSYRKRVLKAADMVSPGDLIPVMIKGIDPEKRRISLSIKEAEGDPWVNIEQRYKPGQRVAATLEKKESFGYFVALEPGVVGLLPISKINSSPDAARIEKIKVDEQIQVLIEAVNPSERKISLDIADDAGKQDWRSYRESASDDSGIGTLGEKLKEALKSGK
ncbi:MAG: 30S ribosomal protein S1 [Desulfobacteraceae bacterium]|nr:30S ribosomal protein S1 [Desulfobacteraceae bacterium]